MEYLVSVIVPVYNVEKYIDKCLKSIISQTYKNLEIILVDDGSTDNSGKLCDEWKKKDDRIKVIHQKNGGVSLARNEGMSVAKGDYVLYADSDDWLDEDMVEILLKGCVENQAEIAACRFREVYRDCTKEEGTEKSFVCTGAEALRYHIFERDKECCFCNAVWNKLCKKNLVEKFKFPVGKQFGEEIGYTSKVLFGASRVYCLDKAKYNYVVEREGSMMNCGVTQRCITDELVLRSEQIDFFKENNLKECEEYCTRILLSKIYVYYWKMIENGKTWDKRTCKKILKSIHQKYENFYQGKPGNNAGKVKILLFKYTPFLLGILYGCALKLKELKQKWEE